MRKVNRIYALGICVVVLLSLLVGGACAAEKLNATQLIALAKTNPNGLQDAIQCEFRGEGVEGRYGTGGARTGLFFCDGSGDGAGTVHR